MPSQPNMSNPRKHTVNLICDHDLLSKEEELELVRLLHEGKSQEIRQNARAELVIRNGRLVVKLAHSFGIHHSNEFDDLVSEGIIGLMKAVEKFNPEKDVRFGTYAVWWIRQSMIRHLQDHSRTIRMPIHWQEAMRKISHASEELIGKGVTPDPELIADATGMTLKQVTRVLSKKIGMISLDAPSSSENKQAFGELIADESSHSPDAKSLLSDDHEFTLELLEALTAREKEILIQRFGLDGSKPQTLEEIGDMWNITRERVRQIQESALKKLKTRLKSSISSRHGKANLLDRIQEIRQKASSPEHEGDEK